MGVAWGMKGGDDEEDRGTEAEACVRNHTISIVFMQHKKLPQLNCRPHTAARHKHYPFIW